MHRAVPTTLSCRQNDHASAVHLQDGAGVPAAGVGHQHVEVAVARGRGPRLRRPGPSSVMSHTTVATSPPRRSAGLLQHLAPSGPAMGDVGARGQGAARRTRTRCRCPPPVTSAPPSREILHRSAPPGGEDGRRSRLRSPPCRCDPSCRHRGQTAPGAGPGGQPRTRLITPMAYTSRIPDALEAGCPSCCGCTRPAGQHGGEDHRGGRAGRPTSRPWRGTRCPAGRGCRPRPRKSTSKVLPPTMSPTASVSAPMRTGGDRGDQLGQRREHAGEQPADERAGQRRLPHQRDAPRSHREPGQGRSPPPSARSDPTGPGC